MPKETRSDEEILADVFAAFRKINEENAIKSEPCHTLAGQLHTRKADDLREVAHILTSGTSKMNKAALVDTIAGRYINSEFLGSLLSVFSRDSWELFKKVAEADRFQEEQMPPWGYHALQKSGLMQLYLHENELLYIVPDEIKQAFAALKQEGFVEEQDHKLLLKAYAEAAVTLYGVITQDDFVALFNKQNKRKTNIDEMFEALIQYVDEESVYCFWEEYIVNSDLEADDFRTVEAYVRNGRGKPRYAPPKEIFLKYEGGAYYEDTPQTEALRDYLDLVYDDEDKAEDFVSAVNYACVTNLPGRSLLNELTAIIEEHGIMNKQQTTDVFHMMMDINNNARCWTNNGLTPNELIQEHGRSSVPSMHKKIGPNDPCPCGGGKKYKKCCMLK